MSLARLPSSGSWRESKHTGFGHGASSARAATAPEIRLLDRGVLSDRGCRALERDAPALQHVGPVGKVERARSQLLDEQDRDAVLAQPSDGAEDLAHQGR